MTQQNYKMMAMVERNYNSLDQLRIKYGTTFNDIVSMLIELYNSSTKEQVTQNLKNSVDREVHGFEARNNPDLTPAQTTTRATGSVMPNEYTNQPK